MIAHVATVVGYVAATLLVQGTSHFVVNAGHYAGVAHIRAEPVFALGIASMVIQGSILSAVYARRRSDRPWAALGLAWAFGGFLLSYMALAEAGKYTVPDPASWIAVETVAAAIQYSLIGAVLWLAHRTWRVGPATGLAGRP